MKTRNLSFLLMAGVVAIIVCYLFVDKQIVWFLYEHHSRNYSILKFFANDITSFITKLICLFYIYYFVKLTIRKNNNFDYKLMLIANSVVIGQTLKEFLKTIFGRYWSDTFINNNLSLIKNNVYGFNWFHSGTSFASFPSGHATFIFSFSVAASILFPKLRYLWVLLALLVIIGQLLMYYHFASDLIAGIMLGTIVGSYTASFYKKYS